MSGLTPPVAASAEDLQRRGAEAFRDGRLAEAEACYRELVARRRHPALLANLGLVLSAQLRFAEAAALLEESLALRPADLNARVALSSALALCDRPAEALACCDAALAVDARHVDSRHNRAVALGALNRNAEAMSVLRELLAESPGDADAEFKLAVNELATRDFAAGWRHYEARWRGARAHPPLPRADIALWRPGEPIGGRAVLAMAEQGLGDTLHFLRWVPRAAAVAKHLELQVQPALVDLVRRHHPQWNVQPLGSATRAPMELRVPLMSLPLALGVDDDSDRVVAPYLHADDARVAAWRERLGPARGRRVALAWRGSPTLRRDALRSIPLTRLAAWIGSCASRGIEILAMQRDATPAEHELLAGMPGVRDLGAQLADFEDTAALLALANHAVAVDTALIHLAGAMGRPATLLAQFAADFRWGLDPARAVLYPGLRLLRQPAPGDWESVFDALREAVA